MLRKLYAIVQRNPAASLMTVIGVFLIGGTFLRGESTRDIVTRVVKDSPCFEDADGKACQRTKRLTDEERSVSSTCVLFYKVDKGGKLLRFTKCPVERGPGPRLKSSSGAVGAPPAGNESIDSSPKSGNQGNSVQGGVGKGGKGAGPKPAGLGSDQPSAPPAGGSAPVAEPANQSPGNSEGNGNSESSKANPVTEGVGSAVEDVGEVVRETGETANEVVEGVTGKACGLVGASC